MEPKKVVILIVLLIGLVFAGRWTCSQWKKYNPPAGDYQYGYYDEDYGGKGKKGPGFKGKAPGTKAPGGDAAAP